MQRVMYFASRIALLIFFAAGPAQAADFPEWAYPPDIPDKPLTATGLRQVPGSSLKLTQAEINNPYFTPDWYPETHPPMPSIVAVGHKPTVEACGLCHLPTGEGHPESGGLSGDTVAYLESQLADFKGGLRKSPITEKMVSYAKGLTDAEIASAVQYFSSLKRIQWNKVIEADTMPKTVMGPHGQTFAVPNGGTEPRPAPIVVLASDPELSEFRASRLGFTAYVPVGSIAKGKAFVESGGNGKSLQCTLCHGVDLKGSGDIPPIAGRSPLTLFRNLNDLKAGVRTGDNTAPMQAVVANLTQDDMVDLAAYVGSLKPD